MRATSALPDKLYRADQVRELDRLAIEKYEIPGHELMERAGAAAFDLLRSTWPVAEKIVVLCGAGNNGGDGYVLARLAHAAGLDVHVLHLVPPDSLEGTARLAADSLLETGFKPEPFAEKKLAGADVLVDALLGTGLDREVGGKWREAIEAVNALKAPVLAIDIPSGLHADSGQPLGIGIKADATITFIGLKRGLFTGQGREYAGKVVFSDLNVPTAIYDAVTPACTLVDLHGLSPLLSVRPRAAHKGHFGHVLVIGGDLGFAGAARLAAEAAARTGAGLVSLATRPEHAAVISMMRPEIMARGVQGAAELQPLLDRANVIAIGPGLGQSDWAMSLFAKVQETVLPLVMDADALNLLAQEPAVNPQWVLTPHPGEAARLLDSDTAHVQADRFAAAGQLQHRYGGVTVLKGSGTLIVGRDGRVSVCAGGNPGMASGGMGDVLTGLIAGFIAQGYDLDDAARLGVCLHAEAADIAAHAGERGLLASDLLPLLRGLINPA